VGTHPAHLADNRNCVLCLTCAQACAHRSVTLRLRPPAADLQRTMDPPAGETGLILVLAGGFCLHHWERLLGWLPAAVTVLASGDGPASATLAGGFVLQAEAAFSLSEGPLLPRLAIASTALALPAALWLAGLHASARLVPGRGRPWLVLYALLPLLWGLMLAHHLAMGMAEGGRVLRVSAAPLLGSSWLGEGHDTLAAVLAGLPTWSADPHVIGFCQTLAVGVGLVGSVVLLRRLLLPERLGWLVLAVATLILAVAGLWVVALG
jgi:hypothetical protein